jgi:hypothetical protein
MGGVHDRHGEGKLDQARGRYDLVRVEPDRQLGPAQRTDRDPASWYGIDKSPYGHFNRLGRAKRISVGHESSNRRA